MNKTYFSNVLQILQIDFEYHFYCLVYFEINYTYMYIDTKQRLKSGRNMVKYSN